MKTLSVCLCIIIATSIISCDLSEINSPNIFPEQYKSESGRIYGGCYYTDIGTVYFRSGSLADAVITKP